MAAGSDNAKAAPVATTAEQEYLESLFWLYEAELPMTGANLARAMRLSAPTVHEMLGRLERDGYIERTSGRLVEGSDQPQEVTDVWTFVRPRGGKWELSAIQQT